MEPNSEEWNTPPPRIISFVAYFAEYIAIDFIVKERNELLSHIAKPVLGGIIVLPNLIKQSHRGTFRRNICSLLSSG